MNINTDTELEPIEDAALEMLLEGEEERILRAQIEGATVILRERSPVGFFTTLRVAEGAERVPARSLAIDGVKAEIPGMSAGIGFVVFVTDGAIDVLEGYTCGDDLPEQTPEFRIVRE